MLIMRPTTLPVPVLMPWARAICWLEPTARRLQPYSVPKNQYMIPIRTQVIRSISQMGLSRVNLPTFRRDTSMFLYLLMLMGTLAREPRSVPIPWIRRLTEYRASWVRIPARMAGMPMDVWKTPVTAPASMPTASAMSVASQGLTPLVIRMAATAPPVAKEPSTVRSAMSRIRKVIYTPMAIMPQIRPWATAPGSWLSSCVMFKVGLLQMLVAVSVRSPLPGSHYSMGR